MTYGVDDQEVRRQLRIMTTMHSVLSGSRTSILHEGNGRAQMYLTTVSMTLVALGFISSGTGMGPGFYLFTFVLLACLILLGVVSFNRVVQIAVQDLRLSRNEARIRQFYAAASPGVEQWFDHDVKDCEADHRLGTGGGSRFQILFTAGSMVGGVNSAVIGVFVGLAVMRFAGAGLTSAALAGSAAFIASGWLHLQQEYRLFAVQAGAPGDPRCNRGDACFRSL